VTVEEALLALLAGLAGILLFLGLAQALGGTPTHHPRRRDRGAPDSSRDRLGAAAVGEPPWGSSPLAERRFGPAWEEPAETPAISAPGRIPPVGVPALSPPTPPLTDAPGPPELARVDPLPATAPVGSPASAKATR